MNYLIITKSNGPFYTNWYSSNFFNKEEEMVVFDLKAGEYTTDGTNWLEIPQDHL